MAGMLEGVVLRIERTSIHDGEGLRTVVFLKGCPLFCIWCSTPESQKNIPERGYLAERCRLCGLCVERCPAGALTMESARVACDGDLCRSCFGCASVCPQGAVRVFGRKMSVSQVVAEISRDEVFYFHSGGGVTISGGECLQQADFVAAVLEECRHRGIDTAVETSLHTSWRNIEKILPWTNTFFVDLKHPDSAKHARFTGVGNKGIVANLLRLDAMAEPFGLHLRIPLIPGINDADNELLEVLALAGTLKRVRDIEILPYHRLGIAGYRVLQRRYALEGVKSPEESYIRERLEFLRSRSGGITIKACGGFAA